MLKVTFTSEKVDFSLNRRCPLGLGACTSGQKERLASATAKGCKLVLGYPPCATFSLSDCKEVVGWRFSCGLPSLSSSPWWIPCPLWAYLLGGGWLFGRWRYLAIQRSFSLPRWGGVCSSLCSSGCIWYHSASTGGLHSLPRSLPLGK